MTGIISRRDFIQQGSILVGLGLMAPSFVSRTAHALGPRPVYAASATDRNVLVVVQLGGGNDGLNTIVPFGDPAYYAARQTLAFARDAVTPMDETVGLAPALEALKGRYRGGHLAVVQGVGYPNPNRSHFRSMDIWQTAVPERIEQSGWLGRYVDSQCCGYGAGEGGAAASTYPVPAVNAQGDKVRAFWTEHALVPSIANLETFGYQGDGKHPDDLAIQLNAFKTLYTPTPGSDAYDDLLTRAGITAVSTAEEIKRVTVGYQPAVTYPDKDPFAASLRMIAQLIAADMGTRIFYVSLGGFDTHANQRNTHERLLKRLADGLDAFTRDLEAQGKLDTTMIMTFSEFGRRVRENQGNGTDHGTAAPMLLLGGGVRGGLYGSHPSLTDLDAGDLKYRIDFRSVYATVLERWLGTSSVPVLGGQFATLDFVGAAREQALG